MEKKKEYSNGEITVVWKPEICIHSANCVKGSPEVFKPKDKPWVQLDGSQNENILKTVETCPSGALSYYRNDGSSKDDVIISSEETKVQVMNEGPLLVFGNLSITHADGREEIKESRTAFCRCSKSANQPYCDGTHNK